MLSRPPMMKSKGHSFRINSKKLPGRICRVFNSSTTPTAINRRAQKMLGRLVLSMDSPFSLRLHPNSPENQVAANDDDDHRHDISCPGGFTQTDDECNQEHGACRVQWPGHAGSILYR